MITASTTARRDNQARMTMIVTTLASSMTCLTCLFTVLFPAAYGNLRSLGARHFGCQACLLVTLLIAKRLFFYGPLL